MKVRQVVSFVELVKPRTGTNVRMDGRPQRIDPKEVLTELFELLEEYAPVWYTEEHHDRAIAALYSVK